MDEIALATGKVTYPTRNFATLGPFMLLRSSDLIKEGAIISVALCLSPDRSDCLFFNAALKSGVQSLRILKSL